MTWSALRLPRPLILALLTLAYRLEDSFAATIIVTNTSDSGPGSLRQAILDSNASSGLVDTIRFKVTGAGCAAGVCRIVPESSYPDLYDPAILDATTQPGYAGAPLIELDGTKLGNFGHGLTLRGGSTVRGFAVIRFDFGLHVYFGSNNHIEANWIGLDATGASAGNRLGIVLEGGLSTGNLIGGSSAAKRNVISGNGEDGILWAGGLGSNNVISGNFIGTDTVGTAPSGNGNGILLRGNQNTVGGTSAGAGNVISGNRGLGIAVAGEGNVVQGNLIGTNAAGTAALGNGQNGVALGGSGNLVGGSTPAGRNVISGNGDLGVVIGSGASDNLVTGNFIGTDRAGTRAIGNRLAGVVVAGDAGTRNCVGSRDLESPDSSQGNVIAFNGGQGVFVFGFDTLTLVLSNSIHSNTELGIDVGALGPTGTVPVITSVRPRPREGVTEIRAALSGPTTAYTHRLQFFSNASCDPAGFGEGRTYLGPASIYGVGENGEFLVTVPTVVSAGRVITGTVTEMELVGTGLPPLPRIEPLRTSEFSACFTVPEVSEVRAIPTLSGGMLALLAVGLAAVASWLLYRA